MGKLEKLLKKLLNPNSTFTFQELEYLLGKFGYNERKTGKTSGSRKAYLNPKTKHIKRIHKPHPGNELKRYVKKYITAELKKKMVNMTHRLKYKEFIGSVHYSAEDEVFYGKIEGVNDLVTFEGNTVAKLKKAFKEAVNDYTELCEQTGKQIFKSFKGSLMLE